MANRSNKKSKMVASLFAVAIGALFFQFGPFSSYSYNHPYLWHDCRALQDLCPSHYATWSPPGGTAPNQHYIYGDCACASQLTVGGHG